MALICNGYQSTAGQAVDAKPGVLKIVMECLHMYTVRPSDHGCPPAPAAGSTKRTNTFNLQINMPKKMKCLHFLLITNT